MIIIWIYYICFSNLPRIGKETIMGNAAITTHAISKGVNIIRAHDFKEIKKNS